MSPRRALAGAGAGDPVHVWLREGGGFPEEFVWRGRRHQVRTIEILAGAARRADQGRRFQVQTRTGIRCVLLQDAGIGSWRIDRMLAPGGVR